MSWGLALFGASLGLSWVNSSLHVLSSQEMLYPRWMGIDSALSGRNKAGLVAALTLLFAPCVVAFCLGVQPLAAGAGAMALMIVIRQLEVREWEGDIVVRLGKYVPAAATLGGYLVAYGVTWGQPESLRVAAGWEAACGVIAAAYGLAGLAKARESGAAWVEARNTALLVAERSFSGPMWLRALRRAVAQTPWLCKITALYGFYGEFAAAAFVFPVARWPVAIAMAVMQAGIILFLGYVEVEWILLMFALSLTSGAALGGL